MIHLKQSKGLLARSMPIAKRERGMRSQIRTVPGTVGCTACLVYSPPPLFLRGEATQFSPQVPQGSDRRVRRSSIYFVPSGGLGFQRFW
jgi:hypothetical protein